MSKPLPSCIDAECSVLGCLLFDNSCYAEVASSLCATDFFDVTNKLIFEAILALNKDNKPFDAILLAEYFVANSTIQAAGGFAYFINLQRLIPSTANLAHYIQLVKSKSILRQLSALTAEVYNDIYKPLTTPAELLMKLQKFVDTNTDKKDEIPFLEEVAELIKEPSAQEWLIKHWLPKECLAMLHAKPGIGKSFLALDWALHIAIGAPWLDNITRSGSVVYLAGEGNQGLKRRVKAWLLHHNVKDVQLPVYISSRGCKLDTIEGFNEVLFAIRDSRIEPALIVVDTLHRFLSGHMNDSQDASKMVYYCDKLKEEFKSTVLLVHHVGHGSDAQSRGMGATAWNAALDVDMHLKRKEDVLELSQTKTKDSKKTEKLLLELREVIIEEWKDSDNEAVESAVMVRSHRVIDDSDDPTIVNAKILFEAAWRWDHSQRTPDNQPCISRDQLIRYLVTVRNYTDASARQLIKAGATDKFINKLLQACLIKIYSNGIDYGWYICSKNWLDTIV